MLKKSVENLLIIMFCLFTTIASGSSNCKPEFQAPKIPATIIDNSNVKDQVNVFYDSSLSMTGFTISQPDETNLFGPIINGLQQISQSLGTETTYNTFGSRLETIDENRASLVTTAEFYRCTQAIQTCEQKDKKKHFLNRYST